MSESSDLFFGEFRITATHNSCVECYFEFNARKIYEQITGVVTKLKNRRMDSFTQIVLGASIAELVVGRAIGRKASLYGATLGTMPDLDVLIDFGGAVENFTYHRSFSHSLLVLSAGSPLIASGLRMMHNQVSFRRLHAMVWLVLTTHALLDALTVYGTQLFWPVSEYPVSGSVLFIIDPAYTLPLALGVLLCLILARDMSLGARLNAVGLAISTIYVGWAVAAKAHVDQVARTSLEDQGIAYNKLLSTPAPFNTLLWRVVVMQPGGYLEGYYSVLDKKRKLKLDRYPSHPNLLTDLANAWTASRLKWFTHGFYSVRSNSPQIVLTDLRMGVEGAYVFRFLVGERQPDGSIKPRNARIKEARDFSRVPLVWRRMWDDSIDLSPRK